jgi:hypothetical protein
VPKFWELMHHYGMTTLELNPIRMRPGKEGRLGRQSQKDRLDSVSFWFGSSSTDESVRAFGLLARLFLCGDCETSTTEEPSPAAG